jgi:hypothetical protein
MEVMPWAGSRKNKTFMEVILRTENRGKPEQAVAQRSIKFGLF